ncbi:D-alanyl-D-alanine carboxypeptidase family protein [Stappia sp.]|uniref:D-alanyl-D-alanine carboxypeptidase family protein n=1 Tax=Stappia sp. TaxID=1870903 RepID=UPI003A992C76
MSSSSLSPRSLETRIHSGRCARLRFAALAGALALALAACQGARDSGRTTALAPVTPSPAVASAALPALQDSGASTSDLAYAPVGSAVVRGHSVIVVDAASGRVLHEEAADGLRYPASLTKMMTLYLLFDALDRGEVTLDTPLKVSANAASRPPARLGLKAGTTIPVRKAIQALAVKSANDVAVTVAENLGGSEDAFAARMMAKARALGMTRTRFVNASGLPDPRQVTTARDMAILARALKTRHADRAGAFTARSVSYGGKTFKTTNNLLGQVAGVDGIKTGYISLSGYNLAASAGRGGHRVIAVVMGGKSEASRDAEVAEILERYL